MANLDRPAAKLGIVAAGYVIAFAIAAVVTRIYVAATSGQDRQTYAAMFDFGDSLLFLGVFGAAAIPATAAALFFLRPRRSIWRLLSVASVTIATTAVAAVVVFVASRFARAGSSLQSWSAVVPLRVFAAPLLALFFILAGVFAPTRSARLCLLGASAIEIVVFVSVVFTWWHSPR